MDPNDLGYQEMVLANEDQESSYSITFKISSNPEISLNKPNAIPYGTGYGVRPLSPTAPVPGKFTFPDASPTLLTPGQHTIKVTFTPDDQEKYNPVTQDMTITITKATPEVVWPMPGPIVQDTPLGQKHLNAIAWANVGSQQAEVKGNATYFWQDQVITPGMKLPAGLHELSVRIEPNASANFEAATGSVQLRVWKAEEVLSDGKDQTFSHLALKYYGHTTPHYWQWIIDANKGNIPDDYKRTRPGTKIFIPEKPPAPGSEKTKKELSLLTSGIHAEVTASSLEVREVPDENGKNLRYLKKGDKIRMTAVWVNEAGDRWGQLEDKGWSAMVFEGKSFMNILKD